MKDVDNSNNSPSEPRLEAIAATAEGRAKLKEVLQDPDASAELKNAVQKVLADREQLS